MCSTKTTSRSLERHAPGGGPTGSAGGGSARARLNLFAVFALVVASLWFTGMGIAQSQETATAAAEARGAIAGIPRSWAARALHDAKENPIGTTADVTNGKPVPLAVLYPRAQRASGTPTNRRIYVMWHGKAQPYWTAGKISWAMGMMLAAPELYRQYS